MDVIHIWEYLTRLHPESWGKGGLRKGTMGIPITADKATPAESNLKFARDMVEVDITKTLPNSITFVDENHELA